MISTYLPLIMYLQPTDECYRMQGFVVLLSLATLYEYYSKNLSFQAACNLSMSAKAGL